MKILFPTMHVYQTSRGDWVAVGSAADDRALTVADQMEALIEIEGRLLPLLLRELHRAEADCGEDMTYHLRPERGEQ